MNRGQAWRLVESQGVPWIFASLLAALAQFRMIVTIVGGSYGDSIAAAKGVVEGMPHWRVYQSRVLGPWLVEGLSTLTGSFEAAHILYTIALYFLAGLAILALAHRAYGAKAAWIAFLSFHLLCLILINGRWHYIWDGGELLSFVLFCAFVITGKDWRWLVGLFAVAVLNRESAFFFAAWMILDPLLTAALTRTRPRLPMLLAGLGCFVFGGGLVYGLREGLLKAEIGPALFGMPGRAGLNVHSHFHDNITYMTDALLHPTVQFNVLVVLILLSPLVLTAVLWRRFGHRYLSLGLVHGLLVLSLPIAGLLAETRVMFDLVPFLAIGLAALSCDDGSDTSEG